MWWNPDEKAGDELVDDEEEEEEEEKEQPPEAEPETGPSLLSAISADESKFIHTHTPHSLGRVYTRYNLYYIIEVNGLPAWSTRLTSTIVPQYAAAIVSSNLWPGAHAIAYKKSVIVKMCGHVHYVVYVYHSRDCIIHVYIL